MKKVISILTVAVLLVACMAVSTFAAGEPKITVDELTAAVGDTVEVKVSMSEATFASYGLKVVYGEGLELKEIKKGERSSAGMFVPNKESGKVALSNLENTTGEGVLFTLVFNVKAEGKHEVKVEVDSFNTADTAEVAVVVDNGFVEVAHVHNWELVEEVKADCLNGGYKVWKCACGETKKTDEVGALGHDLKFTELVEDGERWDCTRCDYYEIRKNDTGDVIGVVIALLAVSGLGITVLRKREN
jgi:hypothetical protein